MDNHIIRRLRTWIAVVTVGLLSAVNSLAAPATRPVRTADGALTPVVNSEKRHEQILAGLKGVSPDIAFLGDSITQNWGAPGKTVWKSYAQYHPVNLGGSGDCTENVLWRITTGGELDTIRPKVIILLIGTNNFGHYADEKPEWAAAGVKKVLDTIQAKLPDTKILLLAVFPARAKDSSYRTRITALNELTKSFADGQKIVYLDIGSIFLDADGNIPKDLMPDALHPSAKGYILWHDAMQKTLDDMLK